MPCHPIQIILKILGIPIQTKVRLTVSTLGFTAFFPLMKQITKKSIDFFSDLHYKIQSKELGL